MDKTKRQRLERKGWKIGSVKEFLALTPEESAYLELKLALSENVRARRQRQHLSQMQLAKRLKSSQSRVAKIEAGDSSVSLDLLVRSLIALGATQQDLAQAIERK
jgi:ribosome-binding protein aMBF1 (putative translation factor)